MPFAVPAAFALILAPAATAAAPPEAPAPRVQTASTYGTKQICRTEIDIGTRLGGKRICRTQSEWDAIRAEQRRATERAQQQGSPCTRGGICSE